MPGLDASRAAQVVARHADGLRFGSGYLVLTDLVITARHVVEDPEGLTVRFIEGPGRVRDVPGSVAWEDRAADLAVVRITPAAKEAPPVLFGRLAGPADCEMVGYPWFKLRSGEPDDDSGQGEMFRDSCHVDGTCNPFSNQRTGLLELAVNSPPPARPDQRRSAWEGMSGAAVFAHDALIGIVTDNFGREGPGILTAMPVTRWFELLAGGKLDDLRRLVGLPGQIEQLSTAARSSSFEPFPQQRLPRFNEAFTGRAAELEGLFSAVEAAPGGVLSIHSVDGLAGVGKTTFAVYAAHRLAARFPDGQIFLDLGTHAPGTRGMSAEYALGQLLLGDGLAPGELPDGLEARKQRWRERTTGRRLLLVLDDVASAAQVRPLIPSARHETLVLVTSRRRLTGLDNATPISVEVFDPDDAARMLVRATGRADLSAHDPEIARLTELCGFLPLALSITAGRLASHRSWQPADVIDEFDSARDRLDALREMVPEDRDESLATALRLSYEDLSEQQRRLFRLLGAHPGTEYEPDAAAALLEADRLTAGRLLVRLEEHRLLNEVIPRKRYRMHDLVREYAAELAVGEAGETGLALTRLLDHYVSMWNPSEPNWEMPHPWLRNERENLLACIDYAYAHDRAPVAMRLSRSVVRLLRTDGPLSLAVDLTCRAVETARRTGDAAALASALMDAGMVNIHRNDYRGAVRAYVEAAEIFGAIGDSAQQALGLTQLGHVHWMGGDYPAAHECFSTALPIVTASGDRAGQARIFLERGELRRMTGDLSDAIDDQNAALEIYREVAIPGGQGRALTMLGEVRYLTRDYAAAARDLDMALAIFKSLGNEPMYVNTLVYRADVRAAQDDLEGGIADLEYALAFLRRDPDNLSQGAVAWTLGHYAALIARTGDTARAVGLYHETVRLSRECTQPDDEALALEGIGECLASSGDIEGATGHISDALRIFEDLGMRPDAERAAARLAELRARLPEHPDAARSSPGTAGRKTR